MFKAMTIALIMTLANPTCEHGCLMHDVHTTTMTITVDGTEHVVKETKIIHKDGVIDVFREEE